MGELIYAVSFVLSIEAHTGRRRVSLGVCALSNTHLGKTGLQNVHAL